MTGNETQRGDGLSLVPRKIRLRVAYNNNHNSNIDISNDSKNVVMMTDDNDNNRYMYMCVHAIIRNTRMMPWLIDINIWIHSHLQISDICL